MRSKENETMLNMPNIIDCTGSNSSKNKYLLCISNLGKAGVWPNMWCTINV